MTEHFAVTGIERSRGRERRAVTLSRLEGDSQLIPCGSAGSRLTDTDLCGIRAALAEGAPVIAEVEHRGFTPDGQLRQPVVRSWEVMN
jgi:bifunctional non-homologous end joining protein LigD